MHGSRWRGRRAAATRRPRAVWVARGRWWRGLRSALPGAYEDEPELEESSFSSEDLDFSFASTFLSAVVRSRSRSTLPSMPSTVAESEYSPDAKAQRHRGLVGVLRVPEAVVGQARKVVVREAGAAAIDARVVAQALDLLAERLRHGRELRVAELGHAVVAGSALHVKHDGVLGRVAAQLLDHVAGLGLGLLGGRRPARRNRRLCRARPSWRRRSSP